MRETENMMQKENYGVQEIAVLKKFSNSPPV